MNCKSSYLLTNGIRIHYMECGQGPVLVLLHGFPEFWYGWKNQIPALSKHFRLIIPDMRGYNLSDKPPKVSDYTIDKLAADIAGIADALHIKSFLLAGHDWGAAVAWATAAIYPERIEKLAILNVPHPEEMSRAFKGFNLKQWRKSWYIFFFQLPYLPEKYVGKNGFFKAAYRGMSIYKDSFNKQDFEMYDQAFSHPGAAKSAIAYYRAAFRSVFRQPKLPKVSCIVLMLWGENDKALGKELTFRTADYCHIPPIIRYNSEAGHFVQHDAPDWVNKALLQHFLPE